MAAVSCDRIESESVRKGLLSAPIADVWFMRYVVSAAMSLFHVGQSIPSSKASLSADRGPNLSGYIDRAAASVNTADWNCCAGAPTLLPVYDWYGYDVSVSALVLLPIVTRVSEANLEEALLCNMMLNALVVSSARVSALTRGRVRVEKRCQFERALSPLLMVVGIIGDCSRDEVPEVVSPSVVLRAAGLWAAREREFKIQLGIY